MALLMISGRVKRGYQRGRKISYPTLNIPVPIMITKRQWGIYITLVKIGNAFYPAVTHLGPPITYGITDASCETYVLGTSVRAYGKQIAVLFLKKIRLVKKFKTSAALRKAIRSDVMAAQSFFDLR